MEMLLISDAKLKVMMTKADMDAYALKGEEVDYDTTEARRAFWSILDEAKRQTGFDAAKDKVLIQLYPSKDGGCELFVTKLGLVPPLAEKTIARSGRVAMLSARRAIYGFERLSELTDACRQVSGCDGVEKSDVYYVDDGKYYLVLEERLGKSERVTELSCLSEYGACLPASQLDYIREHGICIKSGGAVSLFSRL